MVGLAVVGLAVVGRWVGVTPAERPPAVAVLCLAWAAAGGLALTLSWPQTGSDVEVWVLAGLFLALLGAQLFPLHLTHRGESEALRLEEAFFVPMAWLLAPREMLFAIAAAIAVAAVASRRGAVKACFNVGMSVATAGFGLAVAHTLGFGGSLGAGDIAAISAGALVYCVCSAAAVAVVISVAQRVSVVRLLRNGLAMRVGTWLGSISLGVLVLLAADSSRLALVVAVVPAFVLQVAFSGAMRQWRERQQAEALYEAAGRIRDSVDSSHVRAELVAAARQLLSAGSARVVDAPLMTGGSPSVLRVPLDDSTFVEVADGAIGAAWTRDDVSRLHALAAVASSALSNALLYEQLQAITRSLGEGVLALDAGGVITFVNPAAARLLGWRADELVGRHVAAAVDPSGVLRTADGELQWVHLRRLRAGETVRIDEYALTRSDGSVLDAAVTVSPVVREGQVVGMVLSLRDVTERKELEKRLMHQAFHDQLTGLPNRALFLDRLEHARARGSAGLIAVLFVDLDRFKTINDSLGHRAGDDVLTTVASRLVGAVAQGDTVARFGGDEFTVLLEGLTDRSQASAAARRVLDAIARPMAAGDRNVVVSASIGIAVSDPANPEHDLLVAADIAMYEAKSGGRGRYAFAAADADDVARAKLDLEMELRRAIDEGELELEYQPVVRAHGEVLHGFEALVRWRHPRFGMLPPSHFMPLAEETGLVLPLGEWVLEQACRAAKHWQRRLPVTHSSMAVNLSARQFSQPDLCEHVTRALDKAGLDPGRLTLEITETVLMEDTGRTLATLRQLRDIGVRLAIDDFGTGYSSLSYLKRFPVDVVKIDKSFVDGLATLPVDREIVAAVIRLANAVGMETVAEGVETPEQLDQLRLLGCSMVQGFLVAPPEPLADLDRRLGAAAAAGLPVPRAAANDAAVGVRPTVVCLPE